MLNALHSERVGCHIDGRFINVLAYADDLVLLAPSWYAMQHLLDVLKAQSHVINMSCVVLRTSPAFSVFTSSVIDRGGRSLGSHPI